MLRKVKAIVSRLNTGSTDGITAALSQNQQSGSEDGGTVEEQTTSDAETVPPTNLYKCPSCAQVYVATDKRTCATCDVDVERVE